MLRIVSPANAATRVEVIGGALLSFVAGVARVDGALRPPVEAAINARGYRIELELAHDEPTVLAPAALPPVPPASPAAGQ